MVDPEKNRLVEIPPSSCEPPDVRLTVSTSNATITSKKEHAFAYKLCMCNGQVNLDLLLLQNSIMLELCRIAARQNCCSCQFADKRLKGCTTIKAMLLEDEL